MPQPTSVGVTSSASVVAPNAAEKNPAAVTPIWTAARKRLGFWASCATRSPRRPRWAIWVSWLSRNETRAISAAAKIPPISTNSRTSPMLASVSLIECADAAGRYGRADPCGPI